MQKPCPPSWARPKTPRQQRHCCPAAWPASGLSTCRPPSRPAAPPAAPTCSACRSSSTPSSWTRATTSRCSGLSTIWRRASKSTGISVKLKMFLFQYILDFNCSQISINPQGTRRFGLWASSAATLPADDHQRQSRTDLVTLPPARLPQYAGRWICRHGRWERRRTLFPTGCWWRHQTTPTRPPCWAGDPAVVVPAAPKLHVLRWVGKFSRFCTNFQDYKL